MHRQNPRFDHGIGSFRQRRSLVSRAASADSPEARDPSSRTAWIGLATPSLASNEPLPQYTPRQSAKVLLLQAQHSNTIHDTGPSRQASRPENLYQLSMPRPSETSFSLTVRTSLLCTHPKSPPIAATMSISPKPALGLMVRRTLPEIPKRRPKLGRFTVTVSGDLSFGMIILGRGIENYL